MNTSLKIISLVLAASLPSSLAAEFSGLMVPAPVDPIHLFAALVGALVLLTAFGDYRDPRTLRIASTQRTALGMRTHKSAHPLAA